MTYAPNTLKDAREVVQFYTGLSDVEVGIVGDPRHNGGYHQGWDKRRIVNGNLADYSWEESSRDWSHKTDAASAMDIGWFDLLVYGQRTSLIDFNIWLVRECQNNAPDTLDIRSVIYTLDRKTVKRWDRLKKRTGGDNSHLTHTHISRFRDAENKPFAPLFTRFFEGRNVMSLTKRQDQILSNAYQVLYEEAAEHDPIKWITNLDTDEMTELDNLPLRRFKDMTAKLDKTLEALARIEAALKAGAGSGGGVLPSSVTITGGELNLGPAKE